MGVPRSFAFRLQMRVVASACVLAATGVVCHAGPPAEAPASGMEELFRAHSHTISLDDGTLAGPGEVFLLSELENVQFLCLAEPHNVHEIPQFVTALFDRLQDRLRFRYLAIEQGPFITDAIGAMAQSSGNDEIVQFARKRKKALHFRTVEEVEMIADVSRASNGSIQGVWGLDRVLAPSFAEEQLSSASELDEEEVEFLKSRADWSAENLSMYRSRRATGDGPSADQHREDGFKSGFRYYYQRATPEEGPPTRVIFRFGHVHMGRLPGKVYSSLGHFLGEFASENGLDSFHLNIQLINRPGHYWSMTEYPEYEPLANVGDPTKWVIVDLRPAREPLRAGELSAHDKLVKFVFNYDAVLLMGGASKGRKL